MVTAGTVAGMKAMLVARTGRVQATARFEWTMVALCTWLMTGAYLDAWHHSHFRGVDTIYTPWHALLYSGMLAIIAFLGVNLLRNRSRGYALRDALPYGYGLSLMGCGLFGVTGVIDLIGHAIYGIEFNLAALLSPTHLTLMLAGGLIVSGPLRSAWRRPGLTGGYTVVLSAALVFLMFTFFSQFDHPYLNDWAAGRVAPAGVPPDLLEQLGLLGLLLYGGSLTGLVLTLMRRFELPSFSLTVLLGINGLALAPLRDHYGMALVGVTAGIAGDLLRQRLKASGTSPRQFRTYAFALPATLASLYFLTLAGTQAVWWSFPVWGGTIFICGIAGWLLSYVALPPAIDAASGASPKPESVAGLEQLAPHAG